MIKAIYKLIRWGISSFIVLIGILSLFVDEAMILSSIFLTCIGLLITPFLQKKLSGIKRVSLTILAVCGMLTALIGTKTSSLFAVSIAFFITILFIFNLVPEKILLFIKDAYNGAKEGWKAQKNIQNELDFYKKMSHKQIQTKNIDVSDRAIYKASESKKFNFKQSTWNSKKGIIVNIDYFSEENEFTTRKIKVNKVKLAKNGNFIIEAYCYLRNEQRTFKDDNIKVMYDENGEIITIDSLIQQMNKKI